MLGSGRNANRQSIADHFKISPEHMVFTAIHDHFSDLIDLEALADESAVIAKNSNHEKSTYFKYCERAIKKVLGDGSATVDSMVVSFLNFINNENLSGQLLVKVHSPEKNDRLVAHPSQPGFAEKLFATQLAPMEPLSRLDMLRIKEKGQNKYFNRYDISVLARTNFVGRTQLNQSHNSANLINLENDLSKTPRWVAYDYSQNRVYSEFLLEEEERKWLQTLKPGVKLAYAGGTVSDAITSGHAALRWCDQNIFHTHNFAPGSDRMMLRHEMLRWYEQDLDLLQDKKYCHAGVKKLLGSYNSTFESGHFEYLSRASWLGDTNTDKLGLFETNNMSALLRQIDKNDITLTQLKKYWQLGVRYCIPGLDLTMQALNMVSIDNTKDEISFRPLALTFNNIDSIKRTHEQTCGNIFNTTLFDCFKRNPDASMKAEDLVASMLVSFFRVFATKRHLVIDMDMTLCQLNDSEINIMVALMRDNTDVTNMTVNKNMAENPSLSKLKQALLPILARNRWLVANKYRPSLASDHWLEAAFYALQYFSDDSNTDLLTQPTPDKHLNFIGCVNEMSIEGLDAILRCLCDPQRKNRLDLFYRDRRPGFLATCLEKDLNAYLTKLVSHLKEKNNYFPFATIGIKYQPGCDPLFAELFTALNQRGDFEQITLTHLSDQLSPDKLMDDLIARANKEKWCVLINTPELNDDSKLVERYRSLHDKYARLNNIILHNRREVEAKKLVANIERGLAQKDPIEPGNLPAPAATFAPIAGDEPQQAVIGKNNNNAAAMNDDQVVARPAAGGRIWPLTKGARASLQQQQQMQHEEQQQHQQGMQRKQQKQHQKQQAQEQEKRNVPLNMQLVNYNNIDELMKPIYDEIKRSQPNFALKVTRLGHETELQAFFRTCISANPATNATFVIKEMTQAAVKKLLLNHRKLQAGLDIEDLPRGFWTQRDEEESLILCYSNEYGYQNNKSAYTLDLDKAPLTGNDWLGDGRQFNQEEKLSSPQQAILFSTAQPNLAALNLRFAKALGKDQHAVTYKQHWQTNQTAEFDKLSPQDFNLDPRVLWKALLGDSYDEIGEWLATAEKWSDKNVTAVAQVYNAYGQTGISLLMKRLAKLSKACGPEFFSGFKKQFIDPSSNLCELLTPQAFRVFDEMEARFAHNEVDKKLWLALIDSHIASAEWEGLQPAWHAFCEFMDKVVARYEVKINLDVIKRLAIGNMMPFMARLARTLELLGTQKARQSYLDQLDAIDLHHGGAHYAVNYEKFKIYHHNLQLTNFTNGCPTYSPPMRDIYNWRAEEIGSHVKRALAQWKKITHERYNLLTQDGKLINNEPSSKDALILILTTQFGGDDQQLVANIEDIKRQPVLEPLAKHLHHAVYVTGNNKLDVELASLPRLAKSKPLLEATMRLLPHWPRGTLLEITSVLHRKHLKNGVEDAADYEKDVADSLQLLSQRIEPSELQTQALKLAAICGIFDAEQVNALIRNLNVAASPEINQFLKQLLSIDFELSDPSKLRGMWKAACDGIVTIHQTVDRAEKLAKRIEIMQGLRAQRLHFTISANGTFRRLKDSDNNGLFVEQFAPLNRVIWPFLKEYVMVPTDQPLAEVLTPLIEFFHRLNNKTVEVDEYLQLQLLFKKLVKPGFFWSAESLHELLFSVEPGNANSTYPISILSLMMQDPACAPKQVESVSDHVPGALYNAIQANILGARGFTRTEQTQLCQILLTVYQYSPQDLSLFNQALDLVRDAPAAVRATLLGSLKTAKTIDSLQTVITTYQLAKVSIDAITHAQSEPMASHIKDTYQYWINSPHTPKHAALFQQIQETFNDNVHQRSLALHIIAWSSLNQGLKSSDAHADELSRKAAKLVTLLRSLTPADLELVAACYPRMPMPTADDLRRIIKRSRTRNLTLADSLNEYRVNPHALPRPDYGQLPVTRHEDLKRMLQELRVSQDETTAIDDTQYNEIIRAFDYLKKLESGKVFVQGCHQPIHKLSQAEIREALQRLQVNGLVTMEDKIQHWALLFEALYRSTKMYPHMAQQVGIIANDICIKSNKRAMRLETGQGKSHMIALRAAHFALQGKEVDICTAKRSLAERDHLDYEGFYNYIHVTSSNIRDTSVHNDYTKARIHYTTAGDLSLFLDNMSNNGTTIEVNPYKRVGLFDEFDYIRFEENFNTQYNYAASTGYTPFRSMWFYEAIFNYYNENKASLERSQKISEADLSRFTDFLISAAGKDKQRLDFLKKIVANSNTMVQWIQSVHTAMQLQEAKHFVLIESDLLMSGEIYRLKEIVPLSKDNQRIVGSSFSEGVQQLLAMRLHMEGKKDVHVPPQNDIISSQIAENRMQQLWSIQEGYSGTIMPEQISQLRVSNENQFEVLHMPTNQLTLRNWQTPSFFDSHDDQLQAIVRTMRECFAKKQSILFSCKDDTSVNKIKQRLIDSELLTEEELAQFIFSTNADNRDGREVLEDKKRMEQWVRGQQSRGIVLVTSSMNRGDNPDVGAVFLIDHADESDRLQRGGRTARGGETGTVYQFLYAPELRLEYAALQDQVSDLRGTLPGLVPARPVSPIDGKSNLEICDAILELRKELQELVHHTTHQYHQMLSELSTWTLDIFAKINAHPQLVEDTRKKWIAAIKSIAEAWVESASQSGANDDPKKALQRIDNIKREMLDHAKAIYDDCRPSANIAPLTFKQRNIAPINQKIGGDRTTKESISRSNVIANIWMLLYSLNLTTQSDATMQQIMQYLQTLDTTEKVMKFYNHIRVAQPHQIELLLAYIDNSSALAKQGIHYPQLGMPAIKFDTEVKLRFLHPTLAKAVADGLREYGLPEYETLLLPYIAKFDMSSEDDIHMALRFINVFPQLVNETPVALRETRFKLPTMSLERFETIWKLVQTINPNSAQALEIVGSVVSQLTAIEERMLTSWEMLARDMNPEDKLAFFNNFCQVMHAAKQDPRAWDNLQHLFKLTREWWHKGDNAYQAELLEMWKKLNKHSATFAKLDNILTSTIGMKGKSWFKFLNETLDLEPEFIASNDDAVAANIQELHDDAVITKEDKSQFLQDCGVTFPDLLSLASANTITTLANLEAVLPHSIIGDIKFIFDKQKEGTANARLSNLATQYSNALQALTLNKKKLAQLQPALIDNIDYMDVINQNVNLADVNHRYASLLSIGRALDVYARTFKDELFTMLRLEAPHPEVTLLLTTFLDDASISEFVIRSSTIAKTRETLIDNFRNLLAVAKQSNISMTQLTPFIALCPELLTDQNGRQIMTLLANWQTKHRYAGSSKLLSLMIRDIRELIQLGMTPAEAFGRYDSAMTVLPPNEHALANVLATLRHHYAALPDYAKAVSAFQPELGRYQLLTRYLDTTQFSDQQREDIWSHAFKEADVHCRQSYFNLLNAIVEVNDDACQSLNINAIMAFVLGDPKRRQHQLDNLTKFVKTIPASTNNTKVSAMCTNFACYFAALSSAESHEAANQEVTLLLTTFLNDASISEFVIRSSTDAKTRDMMVSNFKSLLLQTKKSDIPLTQLTPLIALCPELLADRNGGQIIQILEKWLKKHRYVNTQLLSSMIEDIRKFITLGHSPADVFGSYDSMMTVLPPDERAFANVRSTLFHNYERLSDYSAAVSAFQPEGARYGLLTRYLDTTQFTAVQRLAIWSYAIKEPDANCRQSYFNLLNAIVEVNDDAYRGLNINSIMGAIDPRRKQQQLDNLVKFVRALPADTDSMKISELCTSFAVNFSALSPAAVDDLCQHLSLENLTTAQRELVWAYAAREELPLDRTNYLDAIKTIFSQTPPEKCKKIDIVAINTALDVYPRADKAKRQQELVNFKNFVARLPKNIPAGLTVEAARAFWQLQAKPMPDQACRMAYLDCLSELLQVNAKNAKEIDFGMVMQRLANINHTVAKLENFKSFIEKLPRDLPAKSINNVCALYLSYFYGPANQSATQLLLANMGEDIPHLKYLLRSDTMNLLAHRVQGNHQPLFLNQARKFFELYKDNGPNIQTLSKNLDHYFEFDAAEHQQQRIAFMHLLFQKAFVLRDDHAQAREQRTWTFEDNNALLKSCFGRYVTESKNILSSKVTKPLRQSHDLTEEQHSKMLALSKELQLVADDRNRGKLSLCTTASGKSDLSKAIRQHLDDYSATWFKSSQRKTELRNLTAQLTDNWGGELNKETPNYELLLSTLRDAKATAMLNDTMTNESKARRYFRAHNASGYSRYYHTINRMYDTVLEAWSKDITSVETFGRYRNLIGTDITRLTNSALTGIASLLKVNPNSLANLNMGNVVKDLKNDWNLYSLWYTSKLIKHQPAVQQLITTLRQLQRDPDSVLSNKGMLDTIDRNITDVMDAIPSHMATQLKELQYSVRLLSKQIGKMETQGLVTDATDLFRR